MRTQTWALIHAGIAFSVLLSCGARHSHAADFNGLDKVTGCRFQAPASWGFRAIRWTGDCVAGAANGCGVLHAYADGKVAEAYYGTIKDGALEIGAIETESGFIAGRLSDGRAVETQDPSAVITAFRAASVGAMQASASFERSGNHASAKIYAEKAKQLEAQMGD